MEQKKLIT